VVLDIHSKSDPVRCYIQAVGGYQCSIMIAGEGVQVRDKEETVVIALIAQGRLDRSYEVSQVELAGCSDAGEAAFAWL
jgi:hypothetical protein